MMQLIDVHRAYFFASGLAWFGWWQRTSFLREGQRTSGKTWTLRTLVGWYAVTCNKDHVKSITWRPTSVSKVLYYISMSMLSGNSWTNSSISFFGSISSFVWNQDLIVAATFHSERKPTETPCFFGAYVKLQVTKPRDLPFGAWKLRSWKTCRPNQPVASHVNVHLKSPKKTEEGVSPPVLCEEVWIYCISPWLDFIVKVWTCSLLGERILEMKDFGCSHAMDLTQLWISRTTTRDGHRTRLNYEHTNKQGQTQHIFSRGLTDFVYSR